MTDHSDEDVLVHEEIIRVDLPESARSVKFTAVPKTIVPHTQGMCEFHPERPAIAGKRWCAACWAEYQGGAA